MIPAREPSKESRSIEDPAMRGEDLTLNCLQGDGSRLKVHPVESSKGGPAKQEFHRAGRAQGKNHTRELIPSKCLAPYALDLLVRKSHLPLT